MDAVPRQAERRIDINATAYAVTSLHLLNSSREKRLYCDFEIRVGSIVLPVHKNVLAIRSEYFAALFRAEVAESKAGFVTMKNVDPGSVVKCIDFIYTGKASVGDGKIGDLLHVAKLLQLHELCDGLVKLMEEDLNETTFFETKQVANMYNLEELEKTCDNFAKKYFREISQDPKFGSLEKDYVEFLLSSEDTVGQEKVKFDALLKWVHYKPGERNEIFPEFLEHFKLERIPRTFYRRLLENEPLVYESASILRKFALCMMNAEALQPESLLLYDTSSQRFYAHPTTQGQTAMTETMLMQSPVSGMENSGFTAVASGGNLFLVIANEKVLYTIEYDDPNATWKTISGMEQTYEKPMLAALDGWLCVMSNSGGEMYNINGDKWTPIPQRPVPNYNPIFHSGTTERCTDSTIASLDGNFYLIGGRICEQWNQSYSTGRYVRQSVNQTVHGITNVDRYDFQTAEWRSCDSMSAHRFSPSATEKGGNLFVLVLKLQMRCKSSVHRPSIGRILDFPATASKDNGAVQWRYA